MSADHRFPASRITGKSDTTQGTKPSKTCPDMADPYDATAELFGTLTGALYQLNAAIIVCHCCRIRTRR